MSYFAEVGLSGTTRDLAKRAEDALRAGAPVNPEHIEDIAIAVAECDEFISTLIFDQQD